ncbi:MAG TPA: DUF6600 domain-containing protein [Usitatibacteraceae bacterium]|nr:DUF6600 domain-containing protein [Usitatibacteraceae bacterium]
MATRLIRWLCVAASLIVATQSLASPPARTGRVTHLEGRVSIYLDREDGWRAARLNMPVTSENSLWTDGVARAEIRIGASAIRLNDDTTLDLVAVQDDLTLGNLQRGTLSLRIRQYEIDDFADKVQIDTADGRVILETDGRYRIDVAAGGFDTRVSVFSGRARFENRETRVPVEAGKQLVVRGFGSGTAVDIRVEAALESGFDRWAEARDARWDRTHSRIVRERWVSPYMTGYEDLDEYGEWLEDREYGRLWAPRTVAIGWAPYRYGHWTYLRPWGWTWVDDAPWGFAPFHYGRWVQVRNRWCWWPGDYRPRPVYAPALVAWFGTPGFGFTVSGAASVGWFPLGPREHYVPPYGHNSVYLQNINGVTNVAIVQPPRSYLHHVNGATIVANPVFTGGRHVGSGYTRLPPASLAQQPVVTNVGLTPRFSRDPRTMPDRRVGPPAPQPRFDAAVPPPGQPRIRAPKESHAEPVRGGPMPAPSREFPSPAQPRVQAPVPPAAATAPQGAPAALPPGSSAPARAMPPPAARQDFERTPGEREARAPRTRGRQPAPETVVPAAPPAPPAPHRAAPPVAPASPPPAITGPAPHSDKAPKPRHEEREPSDKPRGEPRAQPKAAIN